jgi:hypothetical protein
MPLSIPPGLGARPKETEIEKIPSLPKVPAKPLNPLPLHLPQFFFYAFLPKIACQALDSPNPLPNNNIPLHVSYAQSPILNIESKKNEEGPEWQQAIGGQFIENKYFSRNSFIMNILQTLSACR